MLSPCKDVLMHKLARCNYVTYLWKHAHLRDTLANMQTTDHGWKEDNGVFPPLRFTGMTMDPTDVSDGKDDDDDNDEDNYNITEDEYEDDDDSDVD